MSTLTLTTIQSVIKLLLVIAVGFIGAKIGIITKEVNAALTKVLLKIILPLMLFSSYFIEYDSEKTKALLNCALVALIVHIVAIAVVTLIIPKKNNPDYGIDRASSVLGNCGFIGIPLVSLILGQHAVLYMTGYITINSIAGWTYGQQCVANDFNPKSFVRSLLEPSNIAIYLGLILYFTQIKLPVIFTDAITQVGNCNSAIAMIIAGSTIARSDILSTFKDIKLYIPIVFKLAIEALITLVIIKVIGVTGEVALVCFIAGATPTATIINMFAIRDGKNYSRASSIFGTTTLLCMFTLPLMIALYQLF